MNKENIKRNICYCFAGLCFLLGIIRMVYGLYFADNPNPWYDYLVELLFLFFIGAMVIRLSKTFK